MAAKTGIEPVSIPPWQGGVIPLDNMAILVGGLMLSTMVLFCVQDRL